MIWEMPRLLKKTTRLRLTLFAVVALIAVERVLSDLSVFSIFTFDQTSGLGSAYNSSKWNSTGTTGRKFLNISTILYGFNPTHIIGFSTSSTGAFACAAALRCSARCSAHSARTRAWSLRVRTPVGRVFCGDLLVETMMRLVAADLFLWCFYSSTRAQQVSCGGITVLTSTKKKVRRVLARKSLPRTPSTFSDQIGNNSKKERVK